MVLVEVRAGERAAGSEHHRDAGGGPVVEVERNDRPAGHVVRRRSRKREVPRRVRQRRSRPRASVKTQGDTFAGADRRLSAVRVHGTADRLSVVVRQLPAALLTRRRDGSGKLEVGSTLDFASRFPLVAFRQFQRSHQIELRRRVRSVVVVGKYRCFAFLPGTPPGDRVPAFARRFRSVRFRDSRRNPRIPQAASLHWICGLRRDAGKGKPRRHRFRDGSAEIRAEGYFDLHRGRPEGVETGGGATRDDDGVGASDADARPDATCAVHRQSSELQRVRSFLGERQECFVVRVDVPRIFHGARSRGPDGTVLRREHDALSARRGDGERERCVADHFAFVVENADRNLRAVTGLVPVLMRVHREDAPCEILLEAEFLARERVARRRAQPVPARDEILLAVQHEDQSAVLLLEVVGGDRGIVPRAVQCHGEDGAARDVRRGGLLRGRAVRFPDSPYDALFDERVPGDHTSDILRVLLLNRALREFLRRASRVFAIHHRRDELPLRRADRLLVQRVFQLP